jgi:magnesium chelatase family protein
VLKAYQKQIARSGKTNSELSGTELEKVVIITDKQKQILANAIDKLNLSTRAYIKVLKVARTIADLDDNNDVLDKHFIEALSYQRKINLMIFRWCRHHDSNTGPTDYKSVALPAVLCRQKMEIIL